jgi:class 3 adenylate cyclase
MNVNESIAGMPLTCPKCNTANADDARYCRLCGALLSGTVRAVQLRQVTVLACDLVRSTELANQLDPEDLRDLFDEFRRTVRRVAHEHSGLRVRLPVFGGDAARVVFGHPDSREDATESAVRCGLALIEAVRALGKARGLPLELRTGIAFGTAVLDENIEETPLTGENVIGTVPALAVRLMTEAPPGHVAIDHATRRLVGGFFDCQDLGMLRLKGFDAGVRGWLVLGETPVESRHEARRSLDGGDRLVARETELAHLVTAWREACAGRGRGVLIVGDPGVGKSRLARALDEATRADVGSWLEFQCTPRTVNTPLYPITVQVRRLAGIGSADDDQASRERARSLLAQLIDDPARVNDALAYLGPLFQAGQTTIGRVFESGESAELVRARMIQWALELLHALAAQRAPLLIKFEDLHWSDPTTALLLRELLKGVAELKILALITARPETDPAALDLPNTSVMSLQSLDDGAARALVNQLSADEVLPPQMRDWIVARGEGIPLYLEELTRMVLEAEDQRTAGGPASALDHDVPATLQNVIQARLDRRPALRPVTQAAAVLGREFSLSLLQDLVAGALVDVPNAMARLIDDGVLSPLGDRNPYRLRFKHALIHDAVYQTLLRSERVSLHSKVSDILAALAATQAPPPEAAPDVRAYHLRAAARLEEAVVCLIEASAATCAKAAYVESLAHSQEGLALLDSMGDADNPLRKALRRQLLVLKGVALTATSGYAAPAVEEAYRQARTLCDEDADPATLYPIIRGLATYHLVRGDLAVAYDLSVQGLTLAERSGRPDQRIDALSVHGYTSLYTNRLRDARDSLERCLALYRIEGGERFAYPVPQDAGTAAWALLPTVAWLMGDSHAAEAAVKEGQAHVVRLNRPYDSALLHAWLAGTRYTQRRYAEAISHAATGMEVSQRCGYQEWLGISAMMFSLAQGALQPAPDHVANVRTIFTGFQQMGVLLNASYFHWGLARALLNAGDIAGARNAVDEAFRHADASQESRMNGELMILLAELETDDTTAAAHLRQALEVARAQELVPTALRAALTLRLRTAPDARAREEAHEILHTLEDQNRWPAAPGWMRDLLVKTTQNL